MPESKPKKSTSENQNATLIALIGAAATVLAALISGIFATLPATPGGDIAPLSVMTATSTPGIETPIIAPTSAPATPIQLAVEIRGPRNAPLGESTEFTIISQNAVRAVWSIGGFANNQSIEVDDLGPSHQIYVEPTNKERVGDLFTIVVTVYSSDGQTSTAVKEFIVIDEPS